MPEPKRKNKKTENSNESIPISKAIAALKLRGVSKATLLESTQFELFSMFEAKIEDDILRWRQAGATIPEEPKELTLEGLLNLGM